MAVIPTPDQLAAIQGKLDTLKAASADLTASQAADTSARAVADAADSDLAAKTAAAQTAADDLEATMQAVLGGVTS